MLEIYISKIDRRFIRGRCNKVSALFKRSAGNLNKSLSYLSVENITSLTFTK
jgi:hypothetical protein